MQIVYLSGILSLIIQVLTGLYDAFVLTIPTDPSLHIIKDLVKIELAVQMIEGAFYIWMVYNFANIKNITPHRYLDWMITTPTMLLTYSVYLIYMKAKEENKEPGSVSSIVKENWKPLGVIFLLNWMMLLFGFLGEMNVLSTITANILGFIPFFAYFAIIYTKYAKDFKLGRITFFLFSGAWFLYGIAAFFPYKIKNVSFNILDLFAKNFFGIFLATLLLYKNNILTKHTFNKTHF
jgi:hypothetical protein